MCSPARPAPASTGARAAGDLIRSGAESLSVTGVFQPDGEGWRALLEHAGIAGAGDEVVVRRQVSRAGRNRVFVNDQPVTLRLLASVAPYLMRIHAQREELNLVSAGLRRLWLDRVGGAQAAELLRRTAVAYESWHELAERLRRLTGNERLRLERIDLLRFQNGEIDAARLVTGEDDALREERDQLRHRETIVAALEQGNRLLFEDEGAATERLAATRARIEEISGWESEAMTWAAELKAAEIQVEEVARALRDRLDRVTSDSSRLDAVEERLSLLERLSRKYGGSVAEVVAYRQRSGEELEELEGAAEGSRRLEGELESALADYRREALKLSQARSSWGRELSSRVHAELADLAMEKARFAVLLERRTRAGSPLLVDGEPVEMSATGIDHVVFAVATNPGQPMGPLSRIASGGELSRVYLALQLGVRGEIEGGEPTLVFDEVDAGVGGAEAAALGRKLQRLAAGGQILAVTHLPQVASFGDRHFRVQKRADGEVTTVGVERLDDAGQVEEVARMLAGTEVTSLSRSHAEELIADAAAGGDTA